MSTTKTVTPLTKEQVAAQVQQWIADGMPSGQVHPLTRTVHLILTSREDVDVWAAALGAEPVRHFDPAHGEPALTYGFYAKPAALPGWTLSVFASVPSCPAPLRIEVAP